MSRKYKGEVSIWGPEPYDKDPKWVAHIKAEDSYSHDSNIWEKDIYGTGKSIMEALQELSDKTKID